MECEHFAPKSWSRERRQQVASDANILASLSHRVVWGLWDGEARLSIWELYWADERLSWLLWQILRWEAIYGSGVQKCTRVRCWECSSCLPRSGVQRGSRSAWSLVS